MWAIPSFPDAPDLPPTAILLVKLELVWAVSQSTIFGRT